MPRAIEPGFDTFGDVTRGVDGRPKSQTDVLQDVLEEAGQADEVVLVALSGLRRLADPIRVDRDRRAY